MLMMSMTPKIRLRPAAMSAYTPPVSTPSVIAWRSSLSDKRSRLRRSSAPGRRQALPPRRLREDGGLVALRADRERRDEHALLPLERRRLQRRVLALGVELHRALDAVQRDAAVQVGDDLRIVESVRRLHRLGQHLADRVALRDVGVHL